MTVKMAKGGSASFLPTKKKLTVSKNKKRGSETIVLHSKP